MRGRSPTGGPASTGDIARHALLLLAQDTDNRGPIMAMIRNPPPQQFAIDPVSGTLLVTLALVVLESHVEVSRDKQGKWEFKFKETKSSESLIRPLIKKLAALISGGPPSTS